MPGKPHRGTKELNRHELQLFQQLSYINNLLYFTVRTSQKTRELFFFDYEFPTETINTALNFFEGLTVVATCI